MKRTFLTICLVASICVIPTSVIAEETEAGEMRIVSDTDQIKSFEDLEALMEKEREADRRKYGAINGSLKNTFDNMEIWESADIRVHLKMPRIEYLDKTRHSQEELERQSKAVLKSEPVTSVSSLVGKYNGLAEGLRKTDKSFFEAKVDKNTLESIMFDESIAAIEEVVEESPCETTNPDSANIAIAEEREVSKAYFTFPASLPPGLVVEVKKVIDTETGEMRIVSDTDQIKSFEDLEALMEKEREADRRKYGAINGSLKNTFDNMESWEGAKIRVHLKMPRIEYLDKTRHSQEELERQSKAVLKLEPVIPVSSLVGKYKGLSEGLRKTDKSFFEAKVDKNTLESIMFDESIAAIEEVVEESPCETTPFSSLASSAANPHPLPATGHGINAATFETGIWQSFFNCLGNLNSANIAIDDTALSHSQKTFLCLYTQKRHLKLF